MIGVGVGIVAGAASGASGPTSIHPTATAATMFLDAADAVVSGGMSWASQIGSMVFTNPGAAPTKTTVDGKNVVRFTAASSQYLQSNNNASTVLNVAVRHAWVRFRVRSYVGTNVHPTATWNNESAVYTSGTRLGYGNNGGASNVGTWLWDGASKGNHIPCATNAWITLYSETEVIDPPTSPTNRTTVSRLDTGLESTVQFDANDVLSLASLLWLGRGQTVFSNYDIQLVTLATSSLDPAHIPLLHEFHKNGGA